MGLLQGPAQRDRTTVKKRSFRIHQRRLLSKSGYKQNELGQTKAYVQCFLSFFLDLRFVESNRSLLSRGCSFFVLINLPSGPRG